MSQYSFDSDPARWNIAFQPEPDDDLHNPDPKRDRHNDLGGSMLSLRGIMNLGCLSLLILGLVGLFAVYPLVSAFLKDQPSTFGAYNLGGINASGQVPEMNGNFGLIDRDTPKDAYTHKSLEDGSEWDLVFSDEFNTEGRSFYPGDDPYWEAVDLHYWGTNNLEWYSPDMITTSNGSLNITLAKQRWRDLDYKGGLLSSWNKFCFTGGYFMVNVSLPGSSKVYGLWPAVWAMGNLGRAGYGASLDGTWPYTYDSCDVGTLPNQTFPDGTPKAATVHGDKYNKYALSYQPGQRLSACTAKENLILVLNVPTDRNLIGHVSQSGQWAPYNYAYEWLNTTDNLKIYGEDTVMNEYVGGVYQQATSAVTATNQDCYTQGSGCFSIYGFEYQPGTDGYITWLTDDKPTWTIRGAGMGPDSRVEIGARPVPQEPMYLIMNLGMSPNFGPIDWEHLVFPTWMLVDWVRVYQPRGERNIGCSPPDYPTEEYINTYIEAYTNPNLTTWVDDYKQVIPKNRLVNNCT
ncbi:glycoside hydrolase family 16 protein [Ceratobasidium sp. AG-Ba]|nr:glycoside hydrolase family 16 protein [Ceratobasidium sp. AG-Ba]